MTETLDLGPLAVDDFAEFWQVYPRKKDRARAEASYRRARRVTDAAVILTAARAYAASVDGQPAERIRWAVEWLAAEPWRPKPEPVTPPAPTRRRRRADPSKPRRAPHKVTRVRDLETPRQRWIRQHGLTEAEYEQNKGDAEWLARIKRRGGRMTNPTATKTRPANKPKGAE